VSKATLRERISYRFDNFMSRGSGALIGGLAFLSLVIVAIAGAVVALTRVAPEGSEPLGFFEGAWSSLMRTLDAGTMGGDTGWGFRLVMFAVTVGGVFIISALIGILTTGLENKLDALKKGRSRVIESNHTVVFNWSAHVFTIISELAEANANQRRPCIVVMANHDKVEMEAEIKEKAGSTGPLKVVCRSGNPIDHADLRIVGLETCKSIIILSPECGNPDAEVIKTILAVTNSPDRRKAPYHIVAAIKDPQNLEVARMVGKDEVELVLVGDLISRIIAQTCRQSGLSVVYTELLNFGGDEIYFKEEKALTGRGFGEALGAYETSTVIGLFSAKENKPYLNPPMDRLMEAGDSIIAVSEDDDTVVLSGKKDMRIAENAIRRETGASPAPEKTLIIGWNWRAPLIINELNAYVAPGSAITVLAEDPEGKEKIKKACSKCKNATIFYLTGDATDRRTLDGAGIQGFDHVIILCSDTLEREQADARALITLLHLRDIAEKAPRFPAVVTEMLDTRNRELAEVTKADDFIVSDSLVSLVLSQVSENKRLMPVLADIFDPEGSEIYMKRAADYIQPGVTVNFYTAVEAARRRGEIAIGYRVHEHAHDASRAYGVVINPDKSREISFTEDDRLIVIAEG
jgi:voltage-gated potassium channel Kch